MNLSPDPELNRARERGWRELAAIDAALERGEITDAQWHAAILEIIEPAYLAGADPMAQSGYHGGDAAHWEQGRRLILDPVDRDGTFLDIGCANGLLMESVARWAREDGHDLEPYGVDISAKLAQLARDRCPQWADRIWSGNAATWQPPRRFDFVRTGLEYVPDRGREAYVAHVLRFLEPGGRLIIGTHNEATESDEWADEVAGWGYTIAGRTSRPHRHPALNYKVCWIDV